MVLCLLRITFMSELIQEFVFWFAQLTTRVLGFLLYKNNILSALFLSTCGRISNRLSTSRGITYSRMFVDLNQLEITMHSNVETYPQDFLIILKHCFRITRKSWRNVSSLLTVICKSQTNACWPYQLHIFNYTIVCYPNI